MKPKPVEIPIYRGDHNDEEKGVQVDLGDPTIVVRVWA